MLGDGALTFQEFVMGEPLPLATIHEAVLNFLRGRDDAALFGAYAVNAYVVEPRMTQDVDVLSTRAPELSQELRDHLADHFNVAIRLRRLGAERGYRLYQVRKPRNRHLVDVRPVDALPPTRSFADVLVVAPAQLLASKVISFAKRRSSPKSGTDWRDIALLLLAFPELKSEKGPVGDQLEADGVDASILATWCELVAQEVTPEEED
jgi:hypothetical protein